MMEVDDGIAVGKKEQNQTFSLNKGLNISSSSAWIAGILWELIWWELS